MSHTFRMIAAMISFIVFSQQAAAQDCITFSVKGPGAPIASVYKTPGRPCKAPLVSGQQFPGSYAFFTAYHSSSLNDYLRFIVREGEAVDNIVYCPETGAVEVYGIQDATRNFFQQAGNLPGSWVYLYFQDLYGGLFRFQEVQSVTLYINGQNYTLLPVVGDYDPVYPPGRIMLKKWYQQCLDYGTRFKIEDPASFRDPGQRILKEQWLK